MVVWIFAGGGDSEIEGLMPFLKERYTVHEFIRKSPARQKPGSRPPKGKEQGRAQRMMTGHGRTGQSLAEQIRVILTHTLGREQICDLMLIIDDLDCHDPGDRRQSFGNALTSVEGAAAIRSYVGFTSPEIEAWIIADWENTIAKDSDFRGCHQEMRHWLSTEKSVPFDSPEEFSSLDPQTNGCSDKLSEAIVNSSLQVGARGRYSKGLHTPRFLRQISPAIVSRKCPHFRELHNRLSEQE